MLGTAHYRWINRGRGGARDSKRGVRCGEQVAKTRSCAAATIAR